MQIMSWSTITFGRSLEPSHLLHQQNCQLFPYVEAASIEPGKIEQIYLTFIQTQCLTFHHKRVCVHTQLFSGCQW